MSRVNVLDPKLISTPLTVNDKLLQLSARHSFGLERLKASEVRKIINLYNRDIVSDLLAKLQLNLGRGTVTEEIIKETVASTRQFLRVGVSTIRDEFKTDLKDIVLNEHEWQTSVLRNNNPLGIDFRTPPVSLARQIVNSTPIRGRFVNQWFSKLSSDTSQKIAQQLRIGHLQGESIPQIVRRIRGTRAANFKDGIVQESRRNLEAIVRTSINQTTTQARENVFAENQDVVKGIQFVATLDDRTTEICMGLDGKVFEVKSGPRPPMHFNCRSGTAPVLRSWKELGFNIRNTSPEQRASMDGQTAGKLTYGKWLRRESKEKQNEILGVGKAKLFRGNRIRVEDLTDKRNVPLTLKQLKKKGF